MRLALDLADADSEDDTAYEAARESLRKAVRQWARELDARHAVSVRWGKTTAEERSAFASRVATARWRAVHTRMHPPGRHHVRRAGKRRGAPR